MSKSDEMLPNYSRLDWLLSNCSKISSTLVSKPGEMPAIRNYECTINHSNGDTTVVLSYNIEASSQLAMMTAIEWASDRLQGTLTKY